MSGFAGLADEPPDDEWDAAWAAYTSGAETVAEAPLRGRGILPAGVVEVRGDAIGLEKVLPPLDVQDDSDLPVDIVIELTAPGASFGTFELSLSHRRRGVTRRGRFVSDIALVEAVAEFSIDTDDVAVYLDMTVIDDGTQGVAIIGLDETNIDIFDLLTHGPWSLLTKRVTALRHGTRTVWGMDLCRWPDEYIESPIHNPARLTLEPTTIDHIVWIAGDASTAVDATAFESVLTRGELGQRRDETWQEEIATRVGSIVSELVANTDRLVVAPEELSDVLSTIEASKPNRSAAFVDTLGELAISELRSSAVLIGSALDSIDRRGSEETDLPNVVEFLARDSKLHQIEAALRGAQFAPTSASLNSRVSKAGSFIELTNPGSPHDLTIRLFTTVGGGPFAELVDLDDFHDMAAPVRFGEVWLKGVDPAHRFIGACLRFDHDRTGREARDSAVLNVPRTRGEVERVSLFAERCGATSSVRNVTTALMRTFPPSIRDLLEELAN